MKRISRTRTSMQLAALLSVTCAATSVQADVMTFQVSKDATLFESSTGSLSAGGDEGIFVGRTNQLTDAVRRGLIAFDLTAIQPGSTINSVSLRMAVTKSVFGAPPTPVALHRLLGDWGEGTVNTTGEGGAGGNAAPGDATWLHQFRPGDLWTEVGGDFVATSSAQQNVGVAGTTVTWTSTPPLVDDVKRWVDEPGFNFGWLLRGNESLSLTARRFASSEHPTIASRPVLTVDFTPPSMRTPGDVNDDGDVNAADLALFVASYGATTTANNFDVGEFSGDGIVGLADLAIIQRNLSGGGLAAVPEPSALVLCAAAGAVLAFRRTRGRRFGLGTFADVRRD